MRKILLLMIVFFVPFICVEAKTTTVPVEDTLPVAEKVEVTLDNCNSINQIWFKKGKKVIRVGLLAYDSGDTTIENDIKNTICTKLQNATKIEIEYDPNNKTEDKYNRDLAWLYVDGNLLQEELISEGYGMVNYVNADYSYIDDLCIKEAKAIKDKKGIWTLGVEEKYCDSGIILDKIAKEEEIKENGKKLDPYTINRIISIVVCIFLLALTIIIKVKYEEK